MAHEHTHGGHRDHDHDHDHSELGPMDLRVRASGHLMTVKGLTSAAELEDHRQAWAQAAERTPHGRPIELRSHDFPGP